jgi:ABC-type lipoprotein export system ATPase subunit
VYHIKTIEITGFRGQSKKIRLDLHPEANFLIGRNGAGKTTLINLINACLAVNVDALIRSVFESVKITFKTSGERRTPVVTILRDLQNPENPILYSVSQSASGEGQTFFPQRSPSRRVRLASGRIIHRRDEIARSEAFGLHGLRNATGALFRLTWLSLHRAEEEPNNIEDPDEYRSLVERRLSHVFSQLVAYFSRLDGQVAEETKIFQKEWFLSFLSTSVAVTPSVFDNLDLEQEKKALSSIFRTFDLRDENFSHQLDTHFAKIEKIKQREEKKRLYSGLGEISLLIDTMRLHSLVTRWQELQEAQEETYRPKTDYIEIASSLLYRKQLRVDRGNQVKVFSDEGPEIPLRSLSSGEKQLLIFLSETLLQEKETHLFLADEPELSLHVEWQEDLVPSLLAINPNAQVLFATHSPDVVGRFQDQVIKMEEIIE